MGDFLTLAAMKSAYTQAEETQRSRRITAQLRIACFTVVAGVDLNPKWAI